MDITITFDDKVYLILVAVMAALTIVQRIAGKDSKLGKLEAQWYKKLGGRNGIENYIREAASFDCLTNEEKKARVVSLLQKLAIRKLGFPIPTSIVNLLVEYVYRKFKRSSAKLDTKAIKSPGG